MLSIKEINKIKNMYYEKHFTVTFISRRLQISKTTIYKYLKSYNFNADIKIKSNKNNKVAPYRDIIISWLEEDRKHHYKQRHTAKRVYNRLCENFPEFNASYSATANYFRELKKEVFQLHNGYLPLSHTAGECQIDMGECSYVMDNKKVHGYYLVTTFPYSNASYCQLLQAKNTECVLTAIKAIFHHIGGVPHTIWFDNDTSLVRIVKEETMARYYSELFTRFKLHYDFKEVFCSPRKGNEKGSVEAGVRYMRKNLLVPVPNFKNLNKYNIELLKKSAELHNRKHYITGTNICDLHFDDINELNPLPKIPFEIASIKKRKLDNFGRLMIDNKISYYISPLLAYKTIQLKLTATEIQFHDVYGNHILTTNRIYNKNGSRYINPKPYLELLLNKPNAILNFELSDILDEKTANNLKTLSVIKIKRKLKEIIKNID